MADIKIYWHLTELSNWQQVCDQQWDLIKSSGLYDASSDVYLCGNGRKWPFNDWMTKHTEDKLAFAHVNPNSSFYEYPSLNFMHSQAYEAEENYNILYIHLKGVTRPDDPNIRDWRDFLNWSVIERWSDCVKALEDHDVAGPNWETAPWPHFSGNFWWARSDYIKRLPVLQHPVDAMNSGKTMFQTHYAGGAPYWRFDYEAWVGSGDPRYLEVAKSFPVGAQHYNQPYPAENYR